MGAFMRLGVYSWLQSLIILPFLFFPTHSFSAQVWNSVGYWFDPNDYDKDSSKKDGYDFSQCKLDSAKGIEEDGNKREAGNFIKVVVDDDSIVINYGKDKGGFLLSAQWTYATRLKFKAPKQYRKPILNALKNALSNGNCELANYFASMLADGKEYEDSSGRKNWGYSDDTEHGTTCVVGENADSGSCRRKYTYEDNDDGTKRVCVTPAGSGDCSEDLSLDDLSKKTNNDYKNQGGNGSSSSGDGKGNGVDEKRGGANSSSNGTGAGDKGNNTGNSDKTGKGDKGGDGSGNGKGSGIGDKEGDGDKKQGVEIHEAPKMEDIFSGLKEKIKDKLLKDFDISSGQCPTISMSILGHALIVDAHCKILESVRDFIASLMMFLYTFVAIRIVLSA
jgi:hypothetical protein